MSSTLTCTSRSTCSTRTATEPSDGVCRRAFVRRLNSTRSIFSGAQRAVTSSGTLAARSIPLRRASASTPRRHDSTTGSSGAARSSRVSAPASMRASSKRSSTSDERTPTCSRSTGRVVSGSTRPSSSASSIACMFASGVRRSWLAHATSSRRASKSRSRLSAISLNEAARSATSAGPDSGARTARSPPARRAEASRTRSTEPTIEWASTSPATIATVADAAETARIFTSSPMWKATQPDRRTEASGRQTESAASPASCSLRLGSSRNRSTATSPTASVSRPTAIAVPIIATGITGRPGSRHPRRSGGGAGPRDRPRSSRGAGARGR